MNNEFNSTSPKVFVEDHSRHEVNNHLTKVIVFTEAASSLVCSTDPKNSKLLMVLDRIREAAYAAANVPVTK